MTNSARYLADTSRLPALPSSMRGTLSTTPDTTAPMVAVAVIAVAGISRLSDT